MDGWVWSNGGMVLTRETEMLREKYYTALVVDGWMCMERWWIGTDRGNWSAGRKICPIVTLSTINLTCNALLWTQCLPVERWAINSGPLKQGMWNVQQIYVGKETHDLTWGMSSTATLTHTNAGDEQYSNTDTHQPKLPRGLWRRSADTHWQGL